MRMGAEVLVTLTSLPSCISKTDWTCPMSSEVSLAPCTLVVNDVIPVSTRSLTQACGWGAGDGGTSREAVSMLVLALALTSVPVPFEGPLSDASCRLVSACCNLRVCLRRAWRWCKTPRAFSLRRRRSGSSQHSSWPSGIAKPPASIPSTAAPSKSGRGTQADATPTRVPSPGATAALGVSPTSKVVASAPRSVLTPPTSFSLRSEVAACERRRCELAALSALAAFSI